MPCGWQRTVGILPVSGLLSTHKPGFLVLIRLCLVPSNWAQLDAAELHH